MSILDKLKFWKKEEEFTLPPEPQGDMPLEPPSFPQLEEMPKDVPTFAKTFTPEPPPLNPPTFQSPDKNFEILNAKIDAIRATLDAISQRLEKMEKKSDEVRWR